MNDIISQLEYYDEAYEAGNSIIPDVQYDLLKRQAQKSNPTHPYFMKVGATVRGGKVKLPVPMGSLNQIYENEYKEWCSKYNLNNSVICESDKLDGMSNLIQYKAGKLIVAYSRGDGINGADITRHIHKIKNIPKEIPSGHLTIRGELIMSTDKFMQKWKDEYENPRNLVSGVFNRKESDDDILADIDFIAYQIVDGSSENITNSQCTDLQLLNNYGFKVVEHREYFGKELNDLELSNHLSNAKKKSDYELDGIVLTINEKNDRQKLSNSSSLNPEHSVKYKILSKDDYRECKVINIEWNLSKGGLFKPRVEIEPCKLMGVTISWLTGHNAKNIVDNQIGIGSIIKITRSGAVIPYIVENLKKMPITMPLSKWQWDDNHVEIFDPDYSTNPEVIFKQTLDFFETLKVDLLKEATLRKVLSHLNLIDKSYEMQICVILSLMQIEWENIVGINGTKIYTSLERRLNNLTAATFLGALKYFGRGFGVRRAKILLKNLNDDNDVWNLSINSVMAFEGFDIKTATAFVDGLAQAYTLFKRLGLNFIQEVKGTSLQHLNVVFTGFRDAEFQELLEKSGAKVGSTVSKKTTHVLTAEPNSQSSKAKRARELQIITMSLDEFKDEFNL